MQTRKYHFEKRTLKRIVNILLLLLLSIVTFAQRTPITVTTILTPPYTTSLFTMAESGSTRLMVNLLVNDVTITEIPVKLHIKMESAGITIESIPTFFEQKNRQNVQKIE